MSRGDIVVGVDESPESRWAVLWAAREARLRSATLTLVHVRSSVSENRPSGVDAESKAEGLLASGQPRPPSSSRGSRSHPGFMNPGLSASN
jgi:nucleotide-binding universal stress UspA family protein